MVEDGEAQKFGAGKSLWMVATLVILIADRMTAESLVIPVLIAFFMASVSFPVLIFLCKKGVPHLAAVLPIVCLDFIFLAALAVNTFTMVSAGSI